MTAAVIKGSARTTASISGVRANKAQWIAENLKAGEIYAGIILGENSLPDHHLILLPGEATDINWSKAGIWAASVGGDLPTRREQSLLFANLKSEFQPRWYWSREQHAINSDCAWLQLFNNGYQLYYDKSSQWRARAVRRLEI